MYLFLIRNHQVFEVKFRVLGRNKHLTGLQRTREPLLLGSNSVFENRALNLHANLVK